MKKFVKWMLTCNYNRVLATQNFGFAITMVFLILDGVMQFTDYLTLYALTLVGLAIGLVIWGFGMLWQEIRERAEDLWQNN